MCIFSLSCKKIIIIKEKVYCLRELVLWELMVNNKDLGMNWVGIPSVAINIPLEGSLLNFFAFIVVETPFCREIRLSRCIRAQGCCWTVVSGGQTGSGILTQLPGCGAPRISDLRVWFSGVEMQGCRLLRNKGLRKDS